MPTPPLPLYVVRGHELESVSLLENGQWSDVYRNEGAGDD